jgi:hypothetical protein
MKKTLIRIVKKAQRDQSESPSETPFVSDSNRWSKAVRSWVAEFRKNGDDRSAAAFDQLFSKQRLS